MTTEATNTEIPEASSAPNPESGSTDLDALQNLRKAFEESKSGEFEVSKNSLKNHSRTVEQAIDNQSDALMKEFASYGFKIKEGFFSGGDKFKHEKRKLKETSLDTKAEQWATKVSKEVGKVLDDHSSEKDPKAIKIFGDSVNEDFGKESAKGVQAAVVFQRTLNLDKKIANKKLDNASQKGDLSLAWYDMNTNLETALLSHTLKKKSKITAKNEAQYNRFTSGLTSLEAEIKTMEKGQTWWNRGENKKKKLAEKKLKWSTDKETADAMKQRFTDFDTKTTEALEERFKDRKDRKNTGRLVAQTRVTNAQKSVIEYYERFEDAEQGQQQQFIDDLRKFLDAKDDSVKIPAAMKKELEGSDAQIRQTLLDALSTPGMEKIINILNNEKEIDEKAELTTKANTEALNNLESTTKTLLNKSLQIPEDITELKNQEEFKHFNREQPSEYTPQGAELITLLEQQLFNNGKNPTQVYGIENYSGLSDQARMKGLLLQVFPAKKLVCPGTPSQALCEGIFHYLAEQEDQISESATPNSQAEKLQDTIENHLQGDKGILAKAMRMIHLEGDAQSQLMIVNEFLEEYNQIAPKLKFIESGKWAEYFVEKGDVKFADLPPVCANLRQIASNAKTYRDDKIQKGCLEKRATNTKEFNANREHLEQCRMALTTVAKNKGTIVDLETGTVLGSAEGIAPEVEKALKKYNTASDLLQKTTKNPDIPDPDIPFGWKSYVNGFSLFQDFEFKENFRKSTNVERDKSLDLSALLNIKLNEKIRPEINNQFIDQIKQNDPFNSLCTLNEGKQVTLKISETINDSVRIPLDFQDNESYRARVDFAKEGMGVIFTIVDGPDKGQRIEIFTPTIKDNIAHPNTTISDPRNPSAPVKNAICTNFSISS